MNERLISKKVTSIVLLGLVCFTVFVVPVTPQDDQNYIYNICLTLIVAAAVVSMDSHRRFFITFAASAIAVEWLAEFLDIKLVVATARIAIFLFFIVVVVGLITQIAKSRRVTLRVIIEAITGYLLLGLVFALIVMLVNLLNTETFTFSNFVEGQSADWRNYNDPIYYTFVTYTTLGYGDMLPHTPLAKSLAMLTAVTGQIYLTVIIAMLVGKFLSYSQEEKT